MLVTVYMQCTNTYNAVPEHATFGIGVCLL